MFVARLYHLLTSAFFLLPLLITLHCGSSFSALLPSFEAILRPPIRAVQPPMIGVGSSMYCTSFRPNFFPFTFSTYSRSFVRVSLPYKRMKRDPGRAGGRHTHAVPFSTLLNAREQRERESGREEEREGGRERERESMSTSMSWWVGR